MKKLIFLTTILTSIILSACGGSSDPIDPTPLPTPEKDKITFASGITSSLTFGADGGSENISFTASKAWTATLTNSNSDSWCQVEPASGQAGTGSVTIKVAANEDSDGKSAVVQIKSGTATASINVNQLQKNAIVIANKEYTLEKDSTHLDFEVKANVDFKVKVEGDWITQVESRGLTSTTLHFDIAENTTSVEREGKIVISSGDIVQEIKVVQAAGCALLLAIDSIGVSGYEIHLLNLENNTLSMFKLNENSNIDRMDCLTESGETPISISFNEDGLIKSMASDSLTLAFSNYNDCYVDIAVIYGDSMQMHKQVSCDIDWDNMMSGYSMSRKSRVWYDDIEQSELQQGLYDFLSSRVGKAIVAVEEMFEGQFDIKNGKDAFIWMVTSLKGISEIGIEEDYFLMNTIDVAEVASIIATRHPIVALWTLILNYDSYVDWCTEGFYQMMLQFDEWNNENVELGLGALNSGSGDLKATLTWNFYADIDLHAIEPSGEHIYYAEPNSIRSDGFLDYDNVDGGVGSIENIYWENPKDGVYYIFLDYYSGSDYGGSYVEETGNCKVTIMYKGVGKVYNVYMDVDAVKDVTEITLPYGQYSRSIGSKLMPEIKLIIKRMNKETKRKKGN